MHVCYSDVPSTVCLLVHNINPKELLLLQLNYILPVAINETLADTYGEVAAL